MQFAMSGLWKVAKNGQMREVVAFCIQDFWKNRGGLLCRTYFSDGGGTGGAKGREPHRLTETQINTAVCPIIHIKNPQAPSVLRG